MDSMTLQEVCNRLRLIGRIVYAVSDAVPDGKVLHAEETDWYYEYWIFHSEEAAQAVATAVGTTLLHLRDAPMKPPALPTEIRPSALDEMAWKVTWRWR